MKINIIAAMAYNRLIGNKNQLLWHLPADLKHFKTLTMGKTIIMGRKTFESIGKALPGRINIVITRDSTFTAKDCLIAHSLEEAYQLCNKADEVFIIGGATIYQQALEHAHKMYITIVDGEFSGDCYFPEWAQQNWLLTNQEKHNADQNNPYNYSFYIYERLKQ